MRLGHNGPLTIGHHETNDRRNSMLVGPMAAVRVHPEFTAVHIDESSPPDLALTLPPSSCDALIRYHRHTGVRITS